MPGSTRNIVDGEHYGSSLTATVTPSRNPFIQKASAPVITDGNTGVITRLPNQTDAASAVVNSQTLAELMRTHAGQVLAQFPGGVQKMLSIMQQYPDQADKIVGPYFREAGLQLAVAESLRQNADAMATNILAQADAAVAPHAAGLQGITQGIGDKGSGVTVAVPQNRGPRQI